jgi:murein endopeptidase
MGPASGTGVERIVAGLAILTLFLASCGPNGFHEPLASQTTSPVTTYSPPKIQLSTYKVESVTAGVKNTHSDVIADGATTVRDLQLTTDGEKSLARFKGLLTLQPRQGGAPVEIPLAFEGAVTPSTTTGFGVAKLAPLNHDVLTNLKVEATAKLMCLVEDCSEYFVNIYIRHNNEKNFYYHHQVHEVGAVKAPDVKQTSNVPAPEKKPEDLKIAPPDFKGTDENGDYYEKDMEEGGEAGYYVGEPAVDLSEFDKVSKPQPISVLAAPLLESPAPKPVQPTAPATTQPPAKPAAPVPNPAPATVAKPAPSIAPTAQTPAKPALAPAKPAATAKTSPAKTSLAPTETPSKTSKIVSWLQSPFAKKTPPVAGAPAAKPSTSAPVAAPKPAPKNSPAPSAPVQPAASPQVPPTVPKPAPPSVPPTPSVVAPMTPAKPAPAAEPEPEGAAPRTEAEPPKTTFVKLLGQAIGECTQGRLEHATSLLELKDDPDHLGFKIMRPNRKTHFATRDMETMISSMGKFSLQNVNHYILSIGDVSYQKGGRLGQHASHQNGLDADISYYFDRASLQTGFQNALASKTSLASWMIEEQWDLFVKLVKTNNVDRIFIHPDMKQILCKKAIKNGELVQKVIRKKGKPPRIIEESGEGFEPLRRLSPESSHANHFHLRLQCSSAHPLCRPMAPPAMASGCNP